MLLLLSSTLMMLAMGGEIFKSRDIVVLLLTVSALMAAYSVRIRPLVNARIGQRMGMAWALIFVFYCAFFSHVRGPALEYKKFLILAVTFTGVSMLWWRALWQIPLLFMAFFVWASAYFETPYPQIDLWYLQENAIALLAKGKSPYGLAYYASIPLADGWVKSLPYPPGHILSIFLGSLFGDFRWALVVSHVIAALVLFSLVKRGPRWAVLVPIIYLFYPKTITYVWRSWTEPTLIGAIAVATYALSRGRERLLILALGLVLSTKQFGFLFPLALVVARVISIKTAMKGVAIAIAVCLPFLISDPVGLLQGTILSHLNTPPRWDSWSIPALIQTMGGPKLGGLVPFAVISVLALVFYRHQQARGLTSAMALSSTLFLFFFLTSPKAHENYFLTPFFTTLAALLLSQERRQTLHAFA